MIEFEELRISGRPNQYLACPRGYCPGPAHDEAPEFDATVDELEAAFIAVANARPRVSLSEAEPARRQYEWTERSAVLRVPDTITVRFLPLGDDRSTLLIYSRSRFGYYDFGVNAKRVKDWLARTRKALASG